MADDVPEVLAGGNVNAVVRIGDTVRRTSGEWTPTIHALLAWVRAHGVDRVPAPLGIDELGREVVSFLPGDVGEVWSDEFLVDAVGLLRSWHDATVGFDLADARWRLPARSPIEVICLNDVAPYNMVHAGGRLVGFIDVDMASPGPRVWDLSYLAYRLCPFASDADALVDASRRLDLMLAAYGSGPSRDEVMVAMCERLLDLAAWTRRHASESNRGELLAHADMYEADARRLRLS